MIMHSVFVAFILLQVCLEISLVNCQHKNTTKVTSTSTKLTTKNQKRTTTISVPPYCNDKECEARGTELFCACPNNNYSNHITNWPVPKNDSCPSIGCSLSGVSCYCAGLADYPQECECNENKCNKTECAKETLSSGCHCYFGDKVIETSYIPASKNCSDLLKEIGDQNGLYQCSGFSCNCDRYGDCVCLKPKNKNPQTPMPKQCDSEHCAKRSFEFCQCTSNECFDSTCSSDVIFKKLPKTGICSGMLLNSSYQCENVGQKCSCKSDCDRTKTQNKGNNTKTSECVCVDIDTPYSTPISCNYCFSTGSCICTYGEFAVRIPNSPENCKALEKSQTPSTTTFDACPYRDGAICECKRNPNTGQEQCFCRISLKRIPPFNLRSHPHKCCSDDSDCIEHSELYCYCTNYANNTYVKKVSRSEIEKQLLPKVEFDAISDEKLCYAYGHPPDISCHTFGYKAKCLHGFCNLQQNNLYYTTFE